jgi:hypothetical protein
MAVYVDSMKADFGNMKMCHMMADTSEELLAMADEIKVSRRWIQYPGTHREHFDISMSKRALAVKAGAIEVKMRDIGMLMRKKSGKDYDETCITCRPAPPKWTPKTTPDLFAGLE